MARHLYKSMEEVELDLLAFELTERRFALGREVCYLLITVVLVATTVVCALHGFPWPVPTSTGTVAGSFAIRSRSRGLKS